MHFLLYIAIPFVVYILLPVIFVLQMWLSNTASFWKWLIECILFGTYILDIFLSGVWPLTCGYFVRYIVLVIFIFVAIKSFFNVDRSLSLKFLDLKQTILSFVYIGIICLFSIRIVLALNGKFYSEIPVELDFPLKGKSFYVAHGGANQVINHHYPVSSQKYAVDIMGMNVLGFRAKTLYPTNLKDFFIFNETVYSPCDGVVIEAMDEYEMIFPRFCRQF